MKPRSSDIGYLLFVIGHNSLDLKMLNGFVIDRLYLLAKIQPNLTNPLR
jgi:hypothetical protein